MLENDRIHWLSYHHNPIIIIFISPLYNQLDTDTMKLPLAIAYYALQSSFVEGSPFTSLRQRVLSFQTIAGYRPGSQVSINILFWSHIIWFLAYTYIISIIKSSPCFCYYFYTGNWSLCHWSWSSCYWGTVGQGNSRILRSGEGYLQWRW